MLKYQNIFFNFKPFYLSCRNLSSLELWNEVLNTQNKCKIERHWAETLSLNIKRNKKKGGVVKILSAFLIPYKSFNMEHVTLYSLTDAMVRFYRLNGNEVINPIGWDEFGLTSELAAMKSNKLPEIWLSNATRNMKRLLMQLGYNWSEEINTSNSKNYKYTQYIFLKLFEKGLVYQCKGNVYWDPVYNTVVADENVDIRGYSLISGAKVEEKNLLQWYIKTAPYAKALYDGLDNKMFKNCEIIVNKQKQWIGKCDGIEVDMCLRLGNKNKGILKVWSLDPYKFIHGDYLIVSTKNTILKEVPQENYRDLKCFNPITDTEMNMYIIDHVDIHYPKGKTVYLACPSVDFKDSKISEILNVPINAVKQSLNIRTENKRAIKLANDKECGGYLVSSKHKDWLISRQRYWGTPIPIIHCLNCGIVPVPFDQLPVKLPNRIPSDLTTGTELHSNLSDYESWVLCKCPQCLQNARRETDTMDMLVDKFWCFQENLNINNGLANVKNGPVENVPLNFYYSWYDEALHIHLFYVRFISYFLNSNGLLSTKEPINRLLIKGYVLGQSYKVTNSKKYLQPDCVEKYDNEYREKATGKGVLAGWERMSESKYNTENPQRLLRSYGCDTTRLFLLADASPEHNRKWSEASFPGILKWQNKLWTLVRDFIELRNNVSNDNTSKINADMLKDYEARLWERRNHYVSKVTYHFKYTNQLSVVISLLQSFTTVIKRNIPGDTAEVITKSKEYETCLAYLIIMASPLAPHFCSELWAGLSSVPRLEREVSNSIEWSSGVLNQKWPKVDSNYPLRLICNVNGSCSFEIKIEASKLMELTEEKAFQMLVKEVPAAEKVKLDSARIELELYPEYYAALTVTTTSRAGDQPQTPGYLDRAVVY